MPFWGAESKEQADRLAKLLNQLFAEPDLKVRRQAAEALANELQEPVRTRFLEGIEELGVFSGNVSPELEKQFKDGVARLSAMLSVHFKGN